MGCGAASDALAAGSIFVFVRLSNYTIRRTQPARRQGRIRTEVKAGLEFIEKERRDRGYGGKNPVVYPVYLGGGGSGQLRPGAVLVLYSAESGCERPRPPIAQTQQAAQQERLAHYAVSAKIGSKLSHLVEQRGRGEPKLPIKDLRENHIARSCLAGAQVHGSQPGSKEVVGCGICLGQGANGQRAGFRSALAEGLARVSGKTAVGPAAAPDHFQGRLGHAAAMKAQGDDSPSCRLDVSVVVSAACPTSVGGAE